MHLLLRTLFWDLKSLDFIIGYMIEAQYKHRISKVHTVWTLNVGIFNIVEWIPGHMTRRHVVGWKGVYKFEFL